MLLGTSIDINDPPSHQDLLDIGFSMVRMVATTTMSDAIRANYYTRHGIDLSLVLTPQALSTDSSKWYDRTKQIIKLWRPSYLIVGNEPDGSPTEEGASWIMEPTAFQTLLNIVQSARVEPYPEFVVGGMVSGQPTYFDNLTIPHYNAIDIHPYAKIDPLPMLEDYATYLSGDQYLTVGEFNTDPDNLWNFLDQMSSAGTYYAHWFHWSYGDFALTPEHKRIFKEWTDAQS